MKIRYAMNAKIPTPRAHGLQVMKTCEALARAGAEVELVVPRRYNTIKTDPFAYYAIAPIFKITYLSTLEFVRKDGRSYGFALQTIVFTIFLVRYLKKHRSDGFCVYVRGELGWLLPLFSRIPFIWENHIKARKPKAEARAIRSACGVVVITKKYRDDLIREYGMDPEAVLVAPDGVALEEFENLPSKSEARTKLNLPSDKTFALYVGTDLRWKGLRFLREASQLLPNGYEVVYVGPIASQGTDQNQRFVGLRPYEEIPLWLAAADVFVLTGDPHSDIARFYTSPMKLFEYMAARRPIVASDLPSFREVLSEETAILVAPADAQALADGIVHAANDQKSAVRVERAWNSVQKYSWRRRAEHILAFISSRFAL